MNWQKTLENAGFTVDETRFAPRAEAVRETRAALTALTAALLRISGGAAGHPSMTDSIRRRDPAPLRTPASVPAPADPETGYPSAPRKDAPHPFSRKTPVQPPPAPASKSPSPAPSPAGATPSSPSRPQEKAEHPPLRRTFSWQRRRC